MKDPIVFLDIDGVLNTRAYIDRAIAYAENTGRAPATTADALAAIVEPSRVEKLNQIIDVTGAKVVASTDWRLILDLADLNGVLRRRGFQGEIVDVTPDVPKPRGDQIQAWLDANPSVSNFIALDDDEEMTTVAHRAVETDHDSGLTSEHVRRAISLLRPDS